MPSAAFPVRPAAQPPRSDALAALALSLRCPTDQDTPFLQRLFASFQAAEIARMASTPVQAAALLDQQFRLQHHHLVSCFPDADFWIVECADRAGATAPVGRLYLDRSSPLWRVADIGLLPEARGHGLGTALLQWAQACAADSGADGIDLHVVVTNTRAQALYRRLGFAAEEEAEGFHQRMVWRPGAWSGTT